jgi:chemotaxis protein methyltransferase CheR
MQALGLSDVAAYEQYLQSCREEWQVLDGLCRITISRFFRDRSVFAALQSNILPELAQKVADRGGSRVRIWCAGCAAGEEPYSLSIIWELDTKRRASESRIGIEIVATDSDQPSLDRAIAACYSYGSIKGLPHDWRQLAFDESAGEFCLRSRFRESVTFICQDIRVEIPAAAFDLILCRNLVFTYFAEDLQRRILSRLVDVLHPHSLLIIGIHEALPEGYEGFDVRSRQLRIYERVA